MSKKQKNPSQTDVRKVLVESVFDPRDSGPLSVVTEIGTVDYLTTRAIELIRESQGSKDAIFHQNVKMAISLLALARAKKNGPVKKEVKRPRSTDSGGNSEGTSS